ncbi:MAG TPA: hypothetical protein DEH78_00590, partial [Solibacterales bacterium]|nr:hypothetical protein [Bryobacterales bacterium]
MFDSGQLCFLAATLGLSPYTEGGFVIEIGTYTGSTAAFMGKVLQSLDRDTRVCSIDPFDAFRPDPLNPQGNYGAYQI